MEQPLSADRERQELQAGRSYYYCAILVLRID